MNGRTNVKLDHAFLRSSVRIVLSFEEPLIGPWGWRGEEVGLTRLSVDVDTATGKPSATFDGSKAFAVRKDGSVGKSSRRPEVRFPDDWSYKPEYALPDTVLEQLAQVYREVIRTAEPMAEEIVYQ